MVTYRVGITPLIRRLNSTYPYFTQPWHVDNAGSLVMFDNLERYFNLLICNGLAQGYYPDPTKSIVAVHPKISKRGGYWDGVMDLRCKWAYNISGVIWGMTNPNEVGSKIGQRNGREIFIHSEKGRINILRRVTPQWPVRSNWSWSFYNALQRIQDRHSQVCKKFCRKQIYLIFSLEDQEPSLQS